ncbi:MAG: site-2 protease family protein [Puniceicoccales bacterium]|jgi:Zn-dependent protease|nr:site-2 protease family protein [Puniceicoccales bacterium]
MDPQQLAGAALLLIILLVSLSLHEFGHAFVADLRGDPLPRLQGRVTLNPFAHLDPIGSFLIPGVMIFGPLLVGGAFPVALIGWGRPVQISLPNPKTRRLDDILITLAGPAVNIVLALAASLALGVVLANAAADAESGQGYFEAVRSSPVIVRFLLPALFMNVALAFFNMLPVPPLDGSHLLRHAVGMSDEKYALLSRHGWWVMLILINISAVSNLLQKGIEYAAYPFLMLAQLVQEAVLRVSA